MSTELRNLGSPGFRLDSLEAVVKLYEDINKFDVAIFQAAAQKFFQRVGEFKKGDVYLTSETLSEAICGTLVARHLDKNGYSFSEIIQEYEEAKCSIISPPQDQARKLTNTWGSTWFGLVPEYALCKTTKGYLGLVPEAIDSTDEIFMPKDRISHLCSGRFLLSQHYIVSSVAATCTV
ncbi:hypothetical protein L207DRAFT_632045 [Hyaloscypha variabilis F]|uniref:Uncharacterized protein n=1 Tax=Hyaloscypha variabilis (strain UAMH 11265 / GT02V1 / F) TaxID=1149755 RepID=A0A2J6RUN1_HYAVF|nr:hypothetical protein L207DRAFT_632045 [Hyaloscypha variabilis F]